MVIGITGSIGTGKSVVTKYLRDRGFFVLDSDEIVHNLYQETNVIESLKESFGDEVIKDGKVNRKKLGEIIFNDEKKRIDLNKLIHPLVIYKIEIETKDYKNDKGNMVFVEVPLLYEEGLEYLFDKIILIYVDKEIQLQRLMYRDNIDREYALKKIAASIDIEEKKKKADYVIDNRYDLSKTYQEIYKVLRRIENEI